VQWLVCSFCGLASCDICAITVQASCATTEDVERFCPQKPCARSTRSMRMRETVSGCDYSRAFLVVLRCALVSLCFMSL